MSKNWQTQTETVRLGVLTEYAVRASFSGLGSVAVLPGGSFRITPWSQSWVSKLTGL